MYTNIPEPSAATKGKAIHNNSFITSSYRTIGRMAPPYAPLGKKGPATKGID